MKYDIKKRIQISGEINISGFRGTKNYELLENKPSINGIKLIGDKTTEDLHINFEVSPEQIKESINNYLEENPIESTPIDKTLTKENQAADALIVGNKLKQKATYYSNVKEMKEDNSLKYGDIAITLGYYEPNDGGGATYKVRKKLEEDIDNGGNLQELNNGNISYLIEIKKIANPLQWGIKKSDDIYSKKNSEILSYLLKNNYKIIFTSGTYFFDSVDLTGVSNVNIEGEYGRHLYGENITIIKTNGKDFLCKNDNFNIDFWLKNLTIYSNEYSGICVGSSIKNDREINFHIENCGISNFEYGILSYTYASNTQVEYSTLIQNKYGIYIGKACNVGLFRKLSLNFNLYGFTGGGVQCLLENIHLGYGSPITRDENIYGYGIYVTRGTFVKHVYTESYGSNVDDFAIYKIDASNNNILDTVYFEDASFPKTTGYETLYNLYIAGKDSVTGYNNIVMNKCRIVDVKVFLENKNDFLKGVNINNNSSEVYESSWLFNSMSASIILNGSKIKLKDVNYGINVKEITYPSSCIYGYSKLVGNENINELTKHIYDSNNNRINIYDFSKKKVTILAFFGGLNDFVGSKIALGVYLNPIISNSIEYGKYIESPDFYIEKGGNAIIMWNFEVKTQGRFYLCFNNTDGYIIPNLENFKMEVNIY